MSDSRGGLSPTDEELAKAKRSASEALKHDKLNAEAKARLSAISAGVVKQAEEKVNAEKAAKSASMPKKEAASSSASPSAAPATGAAASSVEPTSTFSSIETGEEPTQTNTAAASSSNAPQPAAPIPSLIIEAGPENIDELDMDEPKLDTPASTATTAAPTSAWTGGAKPARGTASPKATSSASSSAAPTSPQTTATKATPTPAAPKVAQPSATTSTPDTTPFTVSIQADMEPSLENENEHDTSNDNSDNNPTPEPSATTDENTPDDIDQYELSDDEKRHLEKNFSSYQMRVEYFLSLARQREDSARAREAYETNQAINFIKTLQRKINALLQDTNLSEKMRVQANDLLYGCRETLSLMEKTSPTQTNILSYGSIPPQVFASFDDAIKSIHGHKDADPTKSTKGFFSTTSQTSLVDSISTSTSEKPYKTVASPKANEYTACYYDIPTSSGLAKAASIQYEDPNTQEFRANLLFDPTTLAALNKEGKEFDVVSGKYIPNAHIMNWAKGVISTFIADSRGAGELKLNCPNMPVVCMKALVLHAKMLGIQISQFSNFRGLMKLEDVTDKHVKLYEKQIETYRDKSQLKDVSQFSVNELRKLEEETNPNKIPLSERLKAGWHKFNKGWRNKDHHAHDPRVRPAIHMPKVDVPETKEVDAPAEETRRDTNKNKP